MKYLESGDVNTPHGNSIVWRYMAHWKLEKLVNNSEIFFANATTLTDQYEVSIPDSTIKAKQKELEKTGFKGNSLKEELARFYWEHNPKKDFVMVNCWSISPHESYALWKIYLGEEKNGVAIKSKVGALKRAVQNGKDPYPEEFLLGKVRYKVHLKLDELARLSIITTKKPYYDFEKELRQFIINEPLSDGSFPPYDIHVGRSVKVDLQVMIHQVYVSPFADATYAKKVEALFRSAGIKDIMLKQSEIREK
ncbi:MAG: hypothetical protein HOO97_05455 [Sideroxydans sp.]|nr:hypothetical protein [Sideroxydans sp.]